MNPVVGAPTADSLRQGQCLGEIWRQIGRHNKEESPLKLRLLNSSFERTLDTELLLRGKGRGAERIVQHALQLLRMRDAHKVAAPLGIRLVAWLWPEPAAAGDPALAQAAVRRWTPRLARLRLKDGALPKIFVRALAARNTQALEQALRGARNLTALDLRHNHASEHLFAQLFVALPKLHALASLRLTGNVLREQATLQLCASAMPALMRLDAHFAIDAACGEVVGQWLAELPALQSLNLVLGEPTVRPTGVALAPLALFTHALVHLQTLKVNLVLSDVEPESDAATLPDRALFPTLKVTRAHFGLRGTQITNHAWQQNT